MYAGAGNYAAVARFFKKRRIGEFEVDRKDHITSRVVASPSGPQVPRVITDAERGGVDVPRNLAAAQFSSPNDPMNAFAPDKFDMGNKPPRTLKPDEPSSLDSSVQKGVIEGPADSSVKSVRNSGIKAYRRTYPG